MSHIERDVCPTCDYWIGAIVELKSTGGEAETALALSKSLRHHVLDYFAERAQQAERDLADVLESHLAAVSERQQYEADAAGVGGDD